MSFLLPTSLSQWFRRGWSIHINPSWIIFWTCLPECVLITVTQGWHGSSPGSLQMVRVTHWLHLFTFFSVLLCKETFATWEFCEFGLWAIFLTGKMSQIFRRDIGKKANISIPLKKPLKYYLKLQVPDVCEDNMLLIGLAELKKA